MNIAFHTDVTSQIGTGHFISCLTLADIHSIYSEVCRGALIARVAMEQFSELKSAPARLAMPDVPEPTSTALTKGFYVRAADIAAKAMEMMGRDVPDVRSDLPEPVPHDVPGEWFKGPFYSQHI